MEGRRGKVRVPAPLHHAGGCRLERTLQLDGGSYPTNWSALVHGGERSKRHAAPLGNVTGGCGSPDLPSQKRRIADTAPRARSGHANSTGQRLGLFRKGHAPHHGIRSPRADGAGLEATRPDRPHVVEGEGRERDEFGVPPSPPTLHDSGGQNRQ